MKRSSIVLFTLSLLLTVAWSSCSKDEKNVQAPAPDNEVITTVQLKAVNTTDPTDTPSAKWVKLNPADTSAPDLTHAYMHLRPNASYTVQVYFLDETKSPADNITTEIKDRGNYHLVCFSPASGLNLSVTATDRDTHSPALPIGLNNLFTTLGGSSGNLNVQLHHQPDLKTGDCSLGSVDADVNFTVTID